MTTYGEAVKLIMDKEFLEAMQIIDRLEMTDEDRKHLKNAVCEGNYILGEEDLGYGDDE
jgi:hypothetical protein